MAENKDIKAENKNFEFQHTLDVRVHKRGYITCNCRYKGNPHTHTCDITSSTKIKFSKCYEDDCDMCFEELAYRNQRTKNVDGYLVCQQCSDKLGQRVICGDCFCELCFELSDDCKCCKFCGFQSNAQCMSYNSDKESNNE